VVETPASTEPFIDELGLGMSKTYQRMGMKPDQVAANHITSEASKKSTHVRSDSAIHQKQNVEKPELEGVRYVYE
jgi:hypothetical protein